MTPQRALLSGNRLHLQHGPIDLVIGAEGARADAFAAAERRFSSVLQELMGEISLLRQPSGPMPSGEIARTMWHAVQGHQGFVTPMAAVAGSVAQCVLKAMCDGADLRRAYVNNGGDIALHLTGQETFTVAMAGLDQSALGQIKLSGQDRLRGIATSGQGGRSLSQGIADSVTVLAETASAADAAATLIAGAVDLPTHPNIRRAPAHEVIEDSDLGALPVVVQVGDLSAVEVAQALERGIRRAQVMQEAGLIHAASLHLRGQSRQVDLNTRKVLEHA